MSTATHQTPQPESPPPWAAYTRDDIEMRFLRREAVLERTGYSERAWYRAIAEGRAPEGQRRGGTVVWSSIDIDAFLRWEAATLPPARSNGKRRHG